MKRCAATAHLHEQVFRIPSNCRFTSRYYDSHRPCSSTRAISATRTRLRVCVSLESVVWCIRFRIARGLGTCFEFCCGRSTDPWMALSSTHPGNVRVSSPGHILPHPCIACGCPCLLCAPGPVLDVVRDAPGLLRPAPQQPSSLIQRPVCRRAALPAARGWGRPTGRRSPVVMAA